MKTRRFCVIKETFRSVGKVITQSVRRLPLRGWIFAPGIMLVVVGIGLVIAPRFLLALGSALFISFGVAFCFVAWKLMQLKVKVESLAKNFQARVVVQQPMHDPFESEIVEIQKESSKKIVYH